MARDGRSGGLRLGHDGSTRDEPWPCFETDLGDAVFAREIVVLHGLPLVLCSWRLSRSLPGTTLCVRPLLSGRNVHALHHEDPNCDLGAEVHDGALLFRPYPSLPAVRSLANARFEHGAQGTPRYAGGVVERDSAYHQGTVWPWLAGPFIEAWVKSRGSTPAAQLEARTRFLEPMLGHLSRAGVSHVSEVADAEPPHAPGGCPFQAWSVSELLRVEQRVLTASRGAPAIAGLPRVVSAGASPARLP